MSEITTNVPSTVVGAGGTGPQEPTAWPGEAGDRERWAVEADPDAKDGEKLDDY